MMALVYGRFAADPHKKAALTDIDNKRVLQNKAVGLTFCSSIPHIGLWGRTYV